MSDSAFDPICLAGMPLRNRFIKTATYEGMSPKGRVSEALIAHHASMAKNGVALTTVAYAAVHPDGRTFDEQLVVDEDNLPALRRLCAAVHSAGGKLSLQLGHCGGFSKLKSTSGRSPMGPSAGWNAYGFMSGVPRIRAMDEDDMAAVVKQFAQAASLARDAGFDALEIHCGHGYLLSQFLSPAINRRHDGWGGNTLGRARLACEVIRAVRSAVGMPFPLLAKINTSDDVPGGLHLEEAIAVAKLLVAAGANALVPSGGLVFKTPFFLMRGEVPVAAMVAAEKLWAQKMAIRLFAPILMRNYPYKSTFFFDEALAIERAVSVPVALLGGVDSAAAVRKAMGAGFAFVALGRALLADPEFVSRMEAGEDVHSRCTHCNRCIGAMDSGGVRCVLEPGEGRVFSKGS